MPKDKRDIETFGDDPETFGQLFGLEEIQPSHSIPADPGDDAVAAAEHRGEEAFKLALRTKEAGDVLSWLNENSCLAFGALPKALAAIEAGAHRR